MPKASIPPTKKKKSKVPKEMIAEASLEVFF